MGQLIRDVVTINIVAAIIVFILSKYVNAFKYTSLEDFLFYVACVIWLLARLMWTGGIYSKTTRLDDAFTDKVYTMVKGHDFGAEKSTHYRQNYQAGFTLFIAGLPALITCVIMYFA